MLGDHVDDAGEHVKVGLLAAGLFGRLVCEGFDAGTSSRALFVDVGLGGGRELLHLLAVEENGVGEGDGVANRDGIGQLGVEADQWLAVVAWQVFV